MPTSRMRRTSPASAWSFGCAALLGVQVLVLAALPFEPVEPADKVVHGLSLAALTLLLWMATDGRRPQLVAATAMLLAFAAEATQAAAAARGADPLDFLAGAGAAALAAGVLYARQPPPRGRRPNRGDKPCAESSEP
ncbi:MAG TPA: hypothetical protein VK043_04175 [Burkholderiales bacterium]|nr:hypothetical protein [Burkholderiales bacterium]